MQFDGEDITRRVPFLMNVSAVQCANGWLGCAFGMVAQRDSMALPLVRLHAIECIANANGLQRKPGRVVMCRSPINCIPLQISWHAVGGFRLLEPSGT
jgi:hypothetical protein